MRKWLAEKRGNKSQYKIAKEIGIPQSTYASIECGNRNPSVQMAKRIAQAMGFEWLLFFEEQCSGFAQCAEKGEV